MGDDRSQKHTEDAHAIFSAEEYERLKKAADERREPVGVMIQTLVLHFLREGGF